jgi:predicted transcriptional regulator
MNEYRTENTLLPKLEELILLAILKHGPEATAGDVQAALSEALGREQAFGSIFTTLDRLSAKKFLKWRRGLPDARRGGRAPALHDHRSRPIHAYRVIACYALADNGNATWRHSDPYSGKKLDGTANEKMVARHQKAPPT